MKLAGVSAAALAHTGCSVEELHGAGYSAQELEAALEESASSVRPR